MTNPSEATGSKPKRGEMIAICSAKGGIGRTVAAVNLAVALSKKNLQVCIVDGDFQFGDVCLALDLHPTFTVKDVVESIQTMDQYSLAGFLMRHSSSVKVLGAPDKPEYADLITTEAMDKVCNLLLSMFDYVVVDTGVGMQPHTLQFIEKADQVFLLTTLEMASVKKTRAMQDTLLLLGVEHKLQIVLNRSTMESVIKASDVARLLDSETPVYIPNDFQIVSQSLNIGIPFVLNHGKDDISKAFFKMAEQMVSRREIALFQPKQHGLLQSLFGKSKKQNNQAVTH